MIDVDKLTRITEIDQWKKTYNEEIEKLDHLYQEEERLYYDLYSTGTQSTRIAEISQIKYQIMTNQKLYNTLIAWREIFQDHVVWKRRLDVFLAKINLERLDSHPELVKLQQKLQSKLMGSKFTYNGIEYNIGKAHSTIMENSDRELRKQLLLEMKKIGRGNEALFRELIQKRNELSKEQGYNNYYSLRCSLREVNMDTYRNEMQNLIEQSKSVVAYWNNRIKEKFGWKRIHLYDQYYTAFNFHRIEGEAFKSIRMKEVLGDIVNSLGINMDHVPVDIKTMEIPYGGFCININPTDIRLVVNKRDSYSAFLSGIHELGHAIDGYFSSYQYPELYRFYSSIAAEAVAELFQTIIADGEFLRKNFDINDELLSQIKSKYQLNDITMIKMNYYYSLVELELYDNPDRSFEEIANQCYQQVFGEEGETFHPASEMFYIENPAFFQDYNYALATRDMIREKFSIKSLYNETDVFQELLNKFIIPNQLFSWNQRVESLCGESHSFKNLVNNISNM
jgi:oligoendopeptidase F